MLPKQQHIQDEIDLGALFVVNHSGGKDSQAMALHLQRLGIPATQILVVHAELPEADWEGIPEHIEATLPSDWTLRYCRAGKTFFEMVERRFESRPDVPSFPSPSTRQCTSDLKRGPINKTIRHYLKANPQFNGRVINCTGIRAEESAARSKQDPWKFNARESKAGRVWREWMPIFDWDERTVRETVRQAGQELHWAYGAGMSRLSCCFCIMASKADLKRAAELRPELAQRYAALEARTGYTMSPSRVSLLELVA